MSDYFVLAPSQMNFTEGAAYCKSKGLGLVVPNSEYENSQLFDYILEKGVVN